MSITEQQQVADDDAEQHAADQLERALRAVPVRRAQADHRGDRGEGRAVRRQQEIGQVVGRHGGGRRLQDGEHAGTQAAARRVGEPPPAGGHGTDHGESPGRCSPVSTAPRRLVTRRFTGRQPRRASACGPAAARRPRTARERRRAADRPEPSERASERRPAGRSPRHERRGRRAAELHGHGLHPRLLPGRAQEPEDDDVVRRVAVPVPGRQHALAAEADALEREPASGRCACSPRRRQALEPERLEGQRRDQRLGLEVRARAPLVAAEPRADRRAAVAAESSDSPVTPIGPCSRWSIEELEHARRARACPRSAGDVGPRLLDVGVRAPGEEARDRRVAPSSSSRGASPRSA